MKLLNVTKKVLIAALAVSAWGGYKVPVAAEESEPSETEKTTIEFEKTDLDVDLKDDKYSLDEYDDLQSALKKYEDTDVVRVSIVLEGKPTIDVFPSQNIAQDKKAMNYRAGLEKKQKALEAEIEKYVLGGKKLDVAWNLTLAANIISAEVEYGKVAEIRKISGVKSVVLETRYAPAVASVGGDDPSMSTSARQIGSAPAYAEGYTGAGSRVAIIDTGIDIEHQSFAGDAFEYSLQKNAEAKGLSYDEYVASLDLLDADEIASVKSHLNIENTGVAASDLYISSKLPFGYNYIDEDLDVIHVNDEEGEHGSHVSGIAAGNKYIAKDGGFASALDTVYTQGVAPDAQILVMKVFGKDGGAYDSDYMAAIEDALVLGADSINLSLGTGMPGFAKEMSYEYQSVLDSLNSADAVVAISAGNAGYYAENDMYVGYTYNDESYFDETGSPGSYTNALTVASVDNVGFSGDYITIDGENYFYTQTAYANKPFSTLVGEQTYVAIDAVGTDEDFAAISSVLDGKIAVCFRGETSFYQKANAAVENGAIGTIIVNNQPGTISMNMTGYKYPAPAVSVTQEVGEALFNNAEEKTVGDVTYYEGTITVGNVAMVDEGDMDASPESGYVMSSFSSWGVPGSLELKPEITAPGGNIYSVFGLNQTEEHYITGGHDLYESMSGTSMAAPQVAGMAALIAQYINENGLAEQEGLTVRQLSQSLLMSTAQPITNDENGLYYSILNQGAGIANVGNAVSAKSYILMDESSTASAADGKVKAELGEDADRTGVYEYTFTINNMSDDDIDYTFDTDFFTQDSFGDPDYGDFLDTWTKMLGADVTYTINGEEFVPGVKIAADVDQDGDTDQDDARCVLQYCIELNDGSEYDLDAADIDEDGEVTTYDAHLILLAVDEAGATVPAHDSVEVTVTAVISDADKAEMDELTPNGAWIEGYTYVKPASTAEGVIQDVEHSIPVLAFYGNYTEAAMFDYETNLSIMTGEIDRYPHSGILAFSVAYVQSLIDSGMFGEPEEVEFTAKEFVEEMQMYWNAWAYSDGEEGYIYTINPYVIESSVPYGKEAIRSDYFMLLAVPRLMRNARAILPVVMNEDGEVLATGKIINDTYGVAYYANYGVWLEAAADGELYFFDGTETEFFIAPEDVGIKEDEKITYAVVAVPEYYLQNKDTVTKDDVIELINSGKLGEGAYMTQTLTVDNTEPELTDLKFFLDPEDEEAVWVEVSAQDNNHVAYAALYDEAYKRIGYTVPQQDAKGEEAVGYIKTTFDGLNNAAFLILSDYADNGVSYTIGSGNSAPVDKEAIAEPEADTVEEDVIESEETVQPEITSEPVEETETVEEPAAETDEETVPETENTTDEIDEISLGGLNAIKVEDPEKDITKADGTVTVNITAEDSTNGLVTVNYDPAVLTYDSTSSSQEYWYVNVDEEAGTVKYDFAAVEAQNGVVAVVTFTYDPENLVETDAEITVTTEEDGESSEPQEQEIDVVLGYEVTIETGEGGTTDQGDTQIIKEGGTIRIKITPKDGYVIDQVLVNGKAVKVGADGIVEIEVTEDTVVKVTFKKAAAPDTRDSNSTMLWTGMFTTAMLIAAGAWFALRRRGTE